MAKNIDANPMELLNQVMLGTEIKGDVSSTGDMRIDGSLIGNLKIKGRVVIGESGKVKGEIQCKNSEVSGKIEGKIMVAEQLSLKATSSIDGDIITNKLAIEPGAKFTGTCNMSNNTAIGGTPLSSKPDEKTTK